MLGRGSSKWRPVLEEPVLSLIIYRCIMASDRRIVVNGTKIMTIYLLINSKEGEAIEKKRTAGLLRKE